MKVRHMRKRAQAKVRSNNAFNWALEKMIRRICASFDKADMALESAFTKALYERQLQQE